MKYVEYLLQEMTESQKSPLVKILGLKDQNNQEILKKLSKVLLPAKGLWQDPHNYRSFMEKIAVKKNEPFNRNQDIPKLEKMLYLNLFKTEYQQLSDVEKEQIGQEMEKAGLDRSQIATLGGLSALGAAQLSGIGVYILASSTVGAISSVLGITLPFAVYTGMSSAISFVIGPLGFLVMGVMLYRSFKHVKSWEEAEAIFKESWNEIMKLARGDYDRATLAFKYIAASRIILEKNFTEETLEIHKKIELEQQLISAIQLKIAGKRSEIKVIQNSILDRKKEATSIENDIRRKQHALQLINNKLTKLHQDIDDRKDFQTELNIKTNVRENKIQSYEAETKQITDKINKITTL